MSEAVELSTNIPTAAYDTLLLTGIKPSPVTYEDTDELSSVVVPDRKSVV